MRIALLAMVMIPVLAFSQSEESLPAFEVALVRPSGPRDRVFGIFSYPGGRVTASNYTAEMLLADAFDVQPFQISGGPQWIKELRFNIEGKPPSSSKLNKLNPASIKLPLNDEQRQMLQQLMIDRFQLKYRRISREGPTYLLVKNGKELRLRLPKNPDDVPWVGNPGGGGVHGDGIAGQNISMPLLAKRLSWYVARPVDDQTGIDGSFDFRFDYQDPDVIATIFISLEGLGLKLKSARGPVETIQITSIEKPSEN